MTRIIGVVALVGLLATPHAASAGELTLRDVIELYRSGLGEDLLVAVIEADGGPIPLSTADVLDLRHAGISDRIITAMLRTARPSATAIAGATPVVTVQQDVTQYAPTVVVVGATPPRQGEPRRHGDGPRVRADRDVPAVSPPSAWVMRRADGQNMTAAGKVESGKPPAAWVTPHTIRTAPPGFHPGNQKTPERGRAADADERKR